ncbi:MAG: DUF3307 domain-containing protein [Acidobacteria bacterium]|nr:DUF3307 domain-containing protein [Acidobacteriota bacterium]
MHQLIKAFLALYLAHLVGDFVFQSDRIVSQKKKGELGGYLRHAAVHYGAILSIACVLWPAWLVSVSFQAVVLSLTVIHLLVDWGKISLTERGKISDNLNSFLIDQILHFATVFVAAWLIVGTPLSEIFTQLAGLRAHEEMVLLLLVVYTAVIFGGGYLVRYMTKPLLQGSALIPGESTDQLRNAGMYIGWLERFLVLTALLLQSPATVGLILTAKSIARYPELKSVRFAEYFLIGTLLSISTAIGGAIVLLKVVYGSIALSK